MTERCPAVRLGPAESKAWGGFLRGHARIVAALDRELRETEGLSISEYEVLLFLTMASGAALRMSDLSGSLPLTPSGVTRVVDRLEGWKLVRRTRSRDDARSFSVALTAAGRARFERASEVHFAGVRRHFLAPLSDAEVGELGRILGKLGSDRGEAEP